MASPGQLSKYRPEYCDMLILHMTQGFSFESFAADIDVHFDTLYEWVKVHPAFSEAKKMGQAKSMKVWERMGMQGAQGEIQFFNCGAWIFNMKNRFKWTDKVEISGSEDQPIKLAYDPSRRVSRKE